MFSIPPFSNPFPMPPKSVRPLSREGQTLLGIQRLTLNDLEALVREWHRKYDNPIVGIPHVERLSNEGVLITDKNYTVAAMISWVSIHELLGRVPKGTSNNFFTVSYGEFPNA